MIAVKEASPKVLANREERFWRQVEKTDSCWNWTGRMGDDGYGRFRYYKLGHIDSAIMAHKWAYINLVGEYSEPQLDHLCRNKVCVNPAHLEPVTEKENTRRGLNGVLRQFCPMGHPGCSARDAMYVVKDVILGTALSVQLLKRLRTVPSLIKPRSYPGPRWVISAST